MRNASEEPYDSIICRDEQIRLLEGIVRKSPCPLPSCLFVYGLAGTGKSLVLSSVLSHRRVKACYVNCVEFYSPRVIYEDILNQLSGHTPSQSNDFSSYASCDNFADFVNHLKPLISDDERYALVFTNSDRLRDSDAILLPSLCRLQELCQRGNVCVVYFSRIPLDKFRVPMGFLEPIVVHFPQYTKDELMKILVSKRPQCCLSEESYKTYISLLLSVFYLATRNLPELKHLAELNLKPYCEPILQGKVDEGNLRHLWKNIEPKFRQALSTVYLREVSSDQFIRMQEITNTGDKKESTNPKSSLTKMELPFYSKFLILAAYLASYNPVRSDKRFFTKHHGKQRKTQAMIKAKQRSCSQLVGPKPFPLDRLLAIFYSIIEDKVAPTAHIFSQISTLVSLRLLTVLNCDDPLGAPKYKSNSSLEFVRSIARTVNFEITKYLYEFSS